MDVLQKRREMQHARRREYFDNVHEKGLFGIGIKEMETINLRDAHQYDDVFAAELKVWRLYTFAPADEVSVSRNGRICIALLWKTIAYYAMQVVDGPLKWRAK